MALVLHTSGTTARPKIIPLTHRNIYASARNHIAALELRANDRCLNVMPLFHIHGLVSALLSSLLAGASIVCTPGFDSIEFQTWIKMFEPTWYTASPTIHQGALVSATQHIGSKIDYPFRFIRSAAAPLSVEVMKALEQTFGVPVIESYGMTEAAAQICSNPVRPRKQVPGSVGIAAGTEVVIMDEAGNVMPCGHTGEVAIRGENVMQGYEKAPAINEKVFVENWLRTGDLGEFDAYGYLFLKGRINEIINRGGKKIAPQEVDEVITEHPAVAEAITFAYPHSTLGEDVVTAVVPKQGAFFEVNDIRSYALLRLADYKVPSKIVIVETIPKSSVGKPQRHLLAEALADDLRPQSDTPRDFFEQQLAIIWANVLGISEIGTQDNFFLIGGNSLTFFMVVNRVNQVFKVNLPRSAIFKEPTLAGQATLIRKLSDNGLNNNTIT